ncbi:hypothetical protein HYH03_015966 [Edaphochlamys debaryana]|uniref:Uncharacterized protein n=1 Tax=Edaphochlamys debaryana TaxID=47281 RepID=A0A836BQD3_9CHLO|nr:hypothetical protein HYH03_015966 [Edaphochlamys debaryana]|eukprot:KAG2485291.1 hypothetical protein HYH03_015966 [Edaphochlamys debaryana]
MSDSSDDDIEPGSATKLMKLIRSTPRRQDVLQGLIGRQVDAAHAAADPDSLEAQIIDAGVTVPFNTWQYEEALRQTAGAAVDRRNLEIEAFTQSLQGAIAELARVRSVEEGRLASKVEEATLRFDQQLAVLQQQFLQEVSKLKRQTVRELNQQRAQSEAAIAARVRLLQGQLRHDRPKGIPSAVGAVGYNGGGGLGGGGGGSGGSADSEGGLEAWFGSSPGRRPPPPGMSFDSPSRPSPGMRLRSSPGARQR